MGEGTSGKVLNWTVCSLNHLHHHQNHCPSVCLSKIFYIDQYCFTVRDQIFYCLLTNIFSCKGIDLPYSFVFQNLKLRGTYHTELPCEQFDETVLSNLIEFCYTGSITVDSVSASRMLNAATTLQITEVEKLCLTFLRAHQSFVCEVML